MADESSTDSSAIPFVDGRTQRPVDALDEAQVLASSQRLGWPGLLVESGRNASWEVDEVVIPRHYLSINLDAQPLVFEAKGEHGFRKIVMEPGSVWMCPAGEAFTHRVGQASTFGMLAIDPEKFDRLSGLEGVRLTRQYAVKDPQLEYLFRALLLEVERGGPGGIAFAEALGTAVSVHLAKHFAAQPERAPAPRGGLPPHRLKRVLELVEAKLEDGASLEEMAKAAGLSPFHFAREFKRAVGVSPHQYLITRRLERARGLLEKPEASIGEVALQLGFSDQSHFTRLFKRQFGATPKQLLRKAR